MRVLAVFLIVLTLALPAAAFEEINTPTFSDRALGGYDAVAYFAEGMPVPGRDEYSLAWKDATWRFASAANRDAFAADPDAFAPRYGGYCSNQMSLGNLSDIDPGVWRIVDGKLYLFGHDAGRVRWSTKTDQRITDADGHWAGFLAD